jgi:hypothetical protein
MRYVFEMSPIILNAIKLMANSFGGTDVKLISKEMYRVKSDESSLVGSLGVDIEIQGMKVFLGYTLAEDITIYGQKVADSFVFEILKSEYLRGMRKLKIQEIHPDIE